MDPKVNHTAANEDVLYDISQYTRLIAQLPYLTFSRPDSLLLSTN